MSRPSQMAVYCCFALMVVRPELRGQQPVIQTGGVLNAASVVSIRSLGPQMLLAIKGQNLATSAEVAAGVPLPFTLGGATVNINGQPAPLLYASPTQINLQAPDFASPSVAYNLVVTTAAGSSQPYALPTAGDSDPGIFTQDATGCGQAFAYNVHPDGSLSWNTPENSFDPMKDLGMAFFLTGLGYFPDRMDGVPWAYNPMDNVASNNAFAINFGAPGITGISSELNVSYAGPAPDTIGVDQVNALGGWSGAPKGCHVPMFLTAGGINSQLVSVSIQPGGGACSDLPGSTLGIMNWQQTTVSQASGVSTSAAIAAQFIQSSELGFAPAGPFPSGLPALGKFGPYDFPVSTPQACAASLPTTLDAGSLKVTGPGIGAMLLTPSAQNGRATYQLIPPGNAIWGGTYQLQGFGGSQVGPFWTNGKIPAPITVTTNLAPGSNLPVTGKSALTFTWTGGTDESVVTLQIIHYGLRYPLAPPVLVDFSTSVPASAGSISIPLASLCAGTVGVEGEPCFEEPEVILTQTPQSAPSLPFIAPGLGLGGELTWTYVFDYKDLN